MSALEPLSTVYEREDLPRFGLPGELRRLYGGDFGLPKRCLFANFVSTIDGVAAIPALRRSNRLISDGNRPDIEMAARRIRPGARVTAAIFPNETCA